MISEKPFDRIYWLQLLSDNARFVLNTISSIEVEDAETIHHYIAFYDQLREQALGELKSWNEIKQDALEGTLSFLQFKINLIERLLIDLPETIEN